MYYTLQRWQSLHMHVKEAGVMYYTLQLWQSLYMHVKEADVMHYTLQLWQGLHMHVKKAFASVDLSSHQYCWLAYVWVAHMRGDHLGFLLQLFLISAGYHIHDCKFGQEAPCSKKPSSVDSASEAAAAQCPLQHCMYMYRCYR